MSRAKELYNCFQESLQNDVVLEDRLYLSTGKRLHHMQLLGYPFCLVLGQKVT